MKTQHTYCDNIHELILLEESGELSRDDAQVLSRHLDKCADCNAYRNDINALMDKSRDALPGGMPSDQTVAKVLSFAETEKSNVVYFTIPWRVASSIAAAFTLLLGSYLAVWTPDNTPDADSEYGISDVHIMVALASDGDVAAPGNNTELTDEAQLKELANTLLKLQGFKLEAEPDSGDVTDLFLPTALQSRSTLASHRGISV